MKELKYILYPIIPIALFICYLYPQDGTVDNVYIMNQNEVVTQLRAISQKLSSATVVPDGIFISSGANSVNEFHIAPTTVSAGQYRNTNISVDVDGRILQIANGAAGGLPLSEGASNYLQNRSTGTVYLLELSTMAAYHIWVGTNSSYGERAYRLEIKQGMAIFRSTAPQERVATLSHGTGGAGDGGELGLWEGDVQRVRITAQSSIDSYINSSGTLTTGLAIGGTNASSRLDVINGSITIRGQNSGLNVYDGGIFTDSMTVRFGTFTINGIKYVYPQVDGSDGQVLKTNASGILTWSADNNSGGGGGDNLGSHIATQSVNMDSFGIDNSTSIRTQLLEVTSSATFTSTVTITNTSDTNSYIFKVSSSNAYSNFVVSTNGAVGVGIFPLGRYPRSNSFHLFRSVGASQGVEFIMEDPDTGGDSDVNQITFKNGTRNAQIRSLFTSGMRIDVDTTMLGLALQGGAVTGLFLDSSSNFVGIGTRNQEPATKLHLSSGTFLIDGTNPVIKTHNRAGRANWTSDNTETKKYNIVIGTLTALNVDIASNTEDGLNAAIARLQPLITATTGQGTIFFKSGTYFISGATVPNGITIYAIKDSSTVWRVNRTSSTMVTNYGAIDGIYFDFLGETGIANVGIDMKSNSKLLNFKVYNAKQRLALTANINVRSSTNVVIIGEMRDYRAIADVGALGDSAALQVWYSTKVHITMNSKSYIAAASGRHYSIIGGKDVHIEGSYFEDAGDIFIGVHEDSSDIYIERNRFNFNGAVAARGLIGIWDDAAIAISTAIRISDNQFNVATDGGRLIAIGQCTDGNQGRNINGVSIINNTARAPATVSTVFAHICENSSRRTVLKGNDTYNMTHITDSGTQTQYTTNDNFSDGVEQ